MSLSKPRYHTLVIFCFAATTVAALSPRALAGGNITLLGQIPIPGATLVEEVWGWVDPATNKEYALVGSNNGLYIVDCSDPTNPLVKANMDSIPGFDIKTYGNYAYTVDGDATGNDGTIVDITDPLNPVVVGNFPSSHNIWIDEPSGTLYLAFAGLRIYDLNPDPANPTFLWQDAIVFGHDCVVVGNRLYDFHGQSGTFIYDVTSLANPVLLGSITDPAIQYHHSGWVSQDGKFLFINDELSNSPTPDFTVWRITNPVSPVKKEEWGDPMATVHNSYRLGNFLHVAYYTAGYRVFDITDPTNISLCDEYDTSVYFGENFRGAFGCYPFTPSGVIYVTDASTGLWVFQFTPTIPTGIPDYREPTFVLRQNFPNPFNPTTTIAYELLEPAEVVLTIHDATGGVVRTLVNEYRGQGPSTAEWDGRDETGWAVASGVYFYRLSANGRTESRRMVLLK